jgi:hypothetical protein
MHPKVGQYWVRVYGNITSTIGPDVICERKLAEQFPFEQDAEVMIKIRRLDHTAGFAIHDVKLCPDITPNPNKTPEDDILTQLCSKAQAFWMTIGAEAAYPCEFIAHCMAKDKHLRYKEYWRFYEHIVKHFITVEHTELCSYSALRSFASIFGSWSTFMQRAIQCMFIGPRICPGFHGRRHPSIVLRLTRGANRWSSYFHQTDQGAEFGVVYTNAEGKAVSPHRRILICPAGFYLPSNPDAPFDSFAEWCDDFARRNGLQATQSELFENIQSHSYHELRRRKEQTVPPQFGNDLHSKFLRLRLAREHYHSSLNNGTNDTDHRSDCKTGAPSVSSAVDAQPSILPTVDSTNNVVTNADGDALADEPTSNANGSVGIESPQQPAQLASSPYQVDPLPSYDLTRPQPQNEDFLRYLRQNRQEPVLNRTLKQLEANTRKVSGKRQRRRQRRNLIVAWRIFVDATLNEQQPISDGKFSTADPPGAPTDVAAAALPANAIHLSAVTLDRVLGPSAAQDTPVDLDADDLDDMSSLA